MIHNQNHIGRLLTLLFPILLTGCPDRFTLIGSVNLRVGGTAIEQNDEPQEGGGEQQGLKCWPTSTKAIAEMRSHGYTFKTWPKTADWFRRLEPLAKSLPPCDR